ncbi:uncharacterized protein LOC128241895 [Mya arenaria]|uniref:uncharacterized protein LOC128241895 n=1 Tax=Mya arenaria TaxID=6604 RepID=UPI0022E2635E|nr:uncharacterized protein LOC128241895 [Mya arenaria]
MSLTVVCVIFALLVSFSEGYFLSPTSYEARTAARTCADKELPPGPNNGVVYAARKSMDGGTPFTATVFFSIGYPLSLKYCMGRVHFDAFGGNGPCFGHLCYDLIT